MNWLYVFVGGGIGSILRYGLSIISMKFALTFPWATLVSNVLASLLIAWIVSLSDKQGSSIVWPFLAVGFCGGLSTFSTFSLETFHLFKTGQMVLGWLNIILSVALSIGMVFLMMKTITKA